MLQSCFQAPKAEIVAVIQTLLRNKRLKNERAKIIWQTLRRFAQPNAGFADYLSAISIPTTPLLCLSPVLLLHRRAYLPIDHLLAITRHGLCFAKDGR